MAEEKEQIELDLDDAQEQEVELEAPKEDAQDAAASDDDNFDKAENATQKRIDRLTKKMQSVSVKRL